MCRERPADERIEINDSKEVYSTARGLENLEAAVLAVVRMTVQQVHDLAALLDHLCPAAHAELRDEIWYRGDTALPLAACGERVGCHVEALHRVCQAQCVHWGPLRTAIICPSRFNDVVEREDSKGAVLATGLIELMLAPEPSSNWNPSTWWWISTAAGIVMPRWLTNWPRRA